MDVIDVIKNRRSIRKYKDEELEPVLIEKLLQAANWAPSAGNSQPWEFVVVRDEFAKKISNEFYKFAKEYIPLAPYIPEKEKQRMLEYSKNFGGAPCHIIVSYPKLEDSFKREEALKASCAAIQNILLQAKAMGLGTVWVGSRLNHSEKVKEILAIPEDRLIAGIIPIGYPDMEPIAPQRQSPDLKEKVKWMGF